ncbi:MAG: bile acid:sodium symporter family protein [Candidatus Promineifilaceae bacterium]|jgi:predicted Na+-dependent transporter
MDVLATLASLSLLVFVVCSMLAMGLSLTMAEIIEPLKNKSLVIKSLLASFVVVPILGYLLTLILPVPEGAGIGIIVVSCAAGAPFLPKLVQMAKGDLAFGVGLMTLLMVLTVIYLPIVLPLLLQGVTVDALAIASSLFFQMLVPLGIGLLIRARYAETAAHIQPTFSMASNIALISLMVLGLVLGFSSFVGAFGSWSILAAVLFIIGAFAIGYFLGGPGQGTRAVVSLGTAQRNLAAAMIVAAGNFTDPDVLTEVLIIALIGLVLLMVAGGELGKRAQGSAVAGKAS